MKVYALYLYRPTGDATCDLIDGAFDFSDINIVYRRNAAEICSFAASQLVTSLEPKMFTVVEERQFRLYCFRQREQASIAVVTEEYPASSAWGIVREIMRESELMGHPSGPVAIRRIREGIRRYQNPLEADKIGKIQKNLEETRLVMVENLKKAVARGESLEELMARSEQISAQSRMFARKAGDLNRCRCVLV
jgi:synaptobrevin family protein YKT6